MPSHLLAIDQNASTLKVGVFIEREGNAPDALTFDYKLDGSATTSQTPVRTPKGLVNVPTTLTAKAIGLTAAFSVRVTAG